MKRPSRRLLALALLAGAAAFPAYLTLARPPVRYTVRGAGMNLGYSSSSMDINNHGEVVGIIDAGPMTAWPFSERDGRPVRIQVPEPPKPYYLPIDVRINDRGDVLVLEEGANRVLLRRDGRVEEVKCADWPWYDSVALAEDGSVAGTILLSNGSRDAVVWKQGRAVRLPAIPVDETYCRGTGVNSAGMVAGRCGETPFIWRNGKAKALSLPPWSDVGDAEALDEQGRAVGSYRDANGCWRACLWEQDTVRDLGALDQQSAAVCINRHGQVVGYSDVSRIAVNWRAWRSPRNLIVQDRTRRATLFENDRATDLNLLIPRNSGWRLETATAINDKGQIVGTGQYEGQQRGFVLTPVTETR